MWTRISLSDEENDEMTIGLIEMKMMDNMVDSLQKGYDEEGSMMKSLMFMT